MMSRLEVRLDTEHRQRLEVLVEAQARPISEVVRDLIDGGYEDVMRERRREAVERLVRLNLDDAPDPRDLSRELEAAHEPGGLG